MSNGTLMIGSYIDDAETIAMQSGAGVITPLSSTSAVSTMPVTNLMNTMPSVKWRSGNYTAGNVIKLSIDIGSVNNRPVNAFALYNHNLTSAGQYRLKGYVDQVERDADINSSGTASKYDSGWVTAEEEASIGYGQGAYATYGYGGYPLAGWLRYKYIAQYLTNALTCRWWAVFIKDSGNTDGYIEAGRLLLTQYFQPSVNMDWGYSIDWVDPSKQIRTRGGSLRSEFRTPYRSVNVSYSWLSESDLNFILEIERLIGKRSEVLWSAYPNENTVQGRRNIILGRLSSWEPIQRQRQGYSFKMVIEESI